MAMQFARQHMSPEQYLLLLQNSDRRYEYHDGEVRLMAGGSSNHATIALNFGIALDQALGDDATCRPYMADKVVRVAPTRIVIPDVVVSCNIADHGESQIIESPILVIEVLSRSTEATDRYEKLKLYQGKETIQEIVYVSQYLQLAEIFTRTPDGWLYKQYGNGQSFHLTSLDLEIEVRQLYRHLSIPIMPEQAKEDDES
ncbi:MAG TPA: Uma2 family endonuclease [Ktedonobacteraceae bacterium]|nr:Uma2 family endonuclease [Ktedonobacteraceae bacterium]